MTLFNDGPSADVITSGNINGGKARKPSVIRIKTSSVLLLEIPENIPMGAPMKIDKKTTPKATFSEDSPA